MKYYRFKTPRAYCPTCSRKMELLFPEVTEKNAEGFYLCFKCRTIGQIGQGQLTASPNYHREQSAARRAEIDQLISELPDKETYQGPGSQLRLEEKSNTYHRRWLSLAEYGKQFGEAPPGLSADFRLDKTSCKWCHQTLVAPRRSFCTDRCSRAYGKATFFKRSLATLPYRIACRDRFYCQVTGEDLALTNSFGVRIPSSNRQLEIHHLVLVSAGGSDHESNLITISKEAHKAYHRADPLTCSLVNAIKEKQLETHHLKMKSR